ncbi:malonate decarboxylase beta subunit [Bradyrhizobium sp. Ghvi]|uniref:biotin-independent malonate decarboxylase subunit beta n=1 Tax=Bradyrhizobium sp. Ghvi TaxID=1855319 RepID=UPI0008F45377|nr:biotin-independent malonate decarboxylase subunit beta [Bradyrhizobium sp. Ghvi]SFP75861.1 malonate decarboxylase beta subunit [Bradyrhizobium sp. Ghvi]
MTAVTANDVSLSWYEASARQRIDALVDAGSFCEFIGPELREISPHLSIFDLPAQFDDGIVIGRGRLDGASVLVAAQEGRFMGGAFGEVHGAKLTGLLRAARTLKQDVVILFDSGGVRLQEANAGELAIAEIMRAVIEARRARVNVVGLIGGRAGCYGGGSLIAGTCSRLIISEQGRLSVSGPEVIETNKGIEEFDSRDRALVWRTMGGKHRYLIGGADAFVEDEALAFRQAAIAALGAKRGCNAAALEAEQKRLERRLQRFGEVEDAIEIWQTLGIDDPTDVPALPTGAFLRAANDRENADDAR